jgi:hypothetical protein
MEFNTGVDTGRGVVRDYFEEASGLTVIEVLSDEEAKVAAKGFLGGKAGAAFDAGSNGSDWVVLGRRVGDDGARERTLDGLGGVLITEAEHVGGKRAGGGKALEEGGELGFCDALIAEALLGRVAEGEIVTEGGRKVIWGADGAAGAMGQSGRPGGWVGIGRGLAFFAAGRWSGAFASVLGGTRPRVLAAAGGARGGYLPYGEALGERYIRWAISVF